MKTGPYPCKECGRMVPILSKGKCPACRSKELPKKERKPIKSKVKPKENKKELDAFFEKHINILNLVGMSAEHKPIRYATRANICHIFPKRTYKSLACLDENIIYLNLDEHTRFDYLLDTMDFDKLKKEFPLTYIMVMNRLPKLFEMVEEVGKLLLRFEEEYEHFKII